MKLITNDGFYFGDTYVSELAEAKKEYDNKLIKINEEILAINSSQAYYVQEFNKNLYNIEILINKIIEYNSLPWYKKLFKKFKI